MTTSYKDLQEENEDVWYEEFEEEEEWMKQ